MERMERKENRGKKGNFFKDRWNFYYLDLDLDAEDYR